MDAAGKVGGFGDAEVGELRFSGIAEKDVRGRDVAVDDACGVAFVVGGVREVERRRERVSEVRREPRVERFPMPAEVTQQRWKVGAYDQLEGE
ncbi:MAG: hypothetical protein WBN60_09185 [Polyangiales bacterium]